MKKTIWLLVLLSMAALPVMAGKHKRFKGNNGFYQIDYPVGFKVKDLGEEAFFISADGKAEFYVYAPYWSEEIVPTIQLNGETEELISREQKKKDHFTLTTFYVKAKDNSYRREYTEGNDDDNNAKHAFGFKYADEATYNKYKQDYEYFQNSLEQFAD